MAALAGANLIYGAGMIESGVTFDCAQFVMDNEFARMIKHVVAGITRQRRDARGGRYRRGGRVRRLPQPGRTLRHMRELSQPASPRPPRARGVGGPRRDRPLRRCPRARRARSSASTGLSRCPTDVAARIHAIVEETDRIAASPDGAGGREQGADSPCERRRRGTDEGATHAGADRGQRRPGERPHPGAAGQRRPGPRDPGRRAAARHGGGRRAHALAATASFPRCCSARAPCRAPSTSCNPHLAAGDSAGLGTVVIGTVEGDLHDIGKNLVGMLLQGAGFDRRQPGHRRHGAAVRGGGEGTQRRRSLGMSALLTTTLPHMAETIAALKDAGLREQVKVMVGGAPVTAGLRRRARRRRLRRQRRQARSTGPRRWWAAASAPSRSSDEQGDRLGGHGTHAGRLRWSQERAKKLSKVLTRFDLVFFTIAAFISLDTIAVTAAYGGGADLLLARSSSSSCGSCPTA